MISPILSNIYLDKLDQYVEKTLIPAYTRGKRRAVNPAYAKIKARYEWKKRQGRKEEAQELRKQFQKLCSYDPNDDTYRRLYYVRYADDTLCDTKSHEMSEVKAFRQVSMPVPNPSLRRW